MARDPMTYRAQRRNTCIRENREEWTPAWYYAGHRSRPIYIPYDSRASRKLSRKSAIYRASRKGDWAGATRAFFSE